MKVGIVYGGYSTEKMASSENAEHIRAALVRKGYPVSMIEYSMDIVSEIRRKNIDIIYVCVQGKEHGDGTLQAMLEHEKIPYTGSKMESACLINNKIISKMIFDYCKIRTPKWEILTHRKYESGIFDYEDFGFPFVAKAPSQGGSFGIELIHDHSELKKLEKVFAYDETILIEEYISGRFYTVGIIERDGKPTTLPIVEGVELRNDNEADDADSLIVFRGDYDAKPAELPQEIADYINQTAMMTFEFMGAEDVARIDYMVDMNNRQAYMLEINAVPGLKPRSLLPKEAAYAGVEYDDLIESILMSAWERTLKRGDGKDV